MLSDYYMRIKESTHRTTLLIPSQRWENNSDILQLDNRSTWISCCLVHISYKYYRAVVQITASETRLFRMHFFSLIFRFFASLESQKKSSVSFSNSLAPFMPPTVYCKCQFISFRSFVFLLEREKDFLLKQTFFAFLSICLENQAQAYCSLITHHYLFFCEKLKKWYQFPTDLWW